METEESVAIVEPRSLTDLINLGTYQGMTDEEIDILLEYKIEHALESEFYKQKEQAMRDDIAAQQLMVESMIQAAKNKIAEINNAGVLLRSVNYE